jgi:acetyl-CoA carboxylase carboxyl transferase subunit alpha
MADNQASGAAAAPAPEPNPPADIVMEASAPADAQPPAIDAPDHPSWQRVQLARHPKRPQATDYIEKLFSGFEELHGDRAFGDDKAIIGGFAYFEGEPVMLIGQQKGRDTKSKLYRNFGMPKPEGYRKALRLMRLADKFHRPIISLIDTAGAYPGIDAEERGQAEAIAYSLREMARLQCPVIAIVIGEGGSGGALAIGVANRVYMLENAYYAVISPESCAAIVWRDAGKAPLAAAALKMTAEDLLRLNVIDGIIPEGPEGAHNDPDLTASSVRETLKTAIAELKTLSRDQLIADRYNKFRQMGNFFHEERP